MSFGLPREALSLAPFPSYFVSQLATSGLIAPSAKRLSHCLDSPPRERNILLHRKCSAHYRAKMLNAFLELLADVSLHGVEYIQAELQFLRCDAGVLSKSNLAHVCFFGMKGPKTVAIEQKSAWERGSHRFDLGKDDAGMVPQAMGPEATLVHP